MTEIYNQAGEGFQWDRWNAEKNRIGHGVLPDECEEVFGNEPLMLGPRSTNDELRYQVVGKTDAGRVLFIAFTYRGPLIRVISARDASRREREVWRHASEPTETDPELRVGG